jgi:hypothetical protein
MAIIFNAKNGILELGQACSCQLLSDGGDLRHPLSTMNIAALLLLTTVLMMNFALRPVELWLYH